jgi:hypothetical protein
LRTVVGGDVCKYTYDNVPLSNNTGRLSNVVCEYRGLDCGKITDETERAECFAKELSKVSGIPVNTDFIRRCKDTAPQKGLNDIERQNNLKDAFCCGKIPENYKRVLVVDDIYTTGSTADAVTEKLMAGGVQEVYFFSVCIGGGS